MSRGGIVRIIAAGSLVCAAGAMLAGCAQPKQGPGYPIASATRSSLVFSGPRVNAWQRSAQGTLPFERFEYSRRDASVSASTESPLLAENQWPSRPRPAERHVRFQYWRQK